MFKSQKNKIEYLFEKVENLEDKNDIFQRKLRNEKQIRIAAEEVHFNLKVLVLNWVNICSSHHFVPKTQK